MPSCTVVVSDSTDLSMFNGFSGVVRDPAPEECAIYLRFGYGTVSIDREASKAIISTGQYGLTRKHEIPLSCVLRTLDADGRPDFY